MGERRHAVSKGNMTSLPIFLYFWCKSKASREEKKRIKMGKTLLKSSLGPTKLHFHPFRFLTKPRELHCHKKKFIGKNTFLNVFTILYVTWSLMGKWRHEEQWKECFWLLLGTKIIMVMIYFLLILAIHTPPFTFNFISRLHKGRHMLIPFQCLFLVFLILVSCWLASNVLFTQVVAGALVVLYILKHLQCLIIIGLL